MTQHASMSANDVESFQNDFAGLAHALSRVIVGQDRVVEELVVGVLSGGHVLLEGLPGLGKTHLAKALARSFGVELVRIQCTPDLMPSDVTGSEILMGDSAGQRRLEFRPGPLFGHLVLVDEINRATPKTQSAFLEAMQEQQVTVGGATHPLPLPFWVLATQNPIELEGTYPLPEAQLDRFSFMVKVNFPDPASLAALADITLDEEPCGRMPTLLPLDRVRTMMAQAREVVISTPVKEAAVALLLMTGNPDIGDESGRPSPVRYGAGPRGLQAMLRAARVHALGRGRAHVSIDDLQRVALPSLRHRVLLSMESEIEGLEVDTLLRDLIDRWSTPLR